MPCIRGPDNMPAMNTKVHLVIEVPLPLLGDCVAVYAVGQLRMTENDLSSVVIRSLPRQIQLLCRPKVHNRTGLAWVGAMQ